MAVPTFRSSTGLGAFNASGTYTVTKPAGTASGDLLVLAVLAASGYYNTGDSDNRLSAGTSGFTNLFKLQINNDSILGVFTKVAGGSEPASYSFGRDTGSNIAAAMACVQTGTYDTTTPVGPTVGTDWSRQFDAVAGVGVDAPTITPPVDECLGLGFWLVDATNVSWTPASGWTEREDTTGGTSYMSVHLATSALTTAATGAVTATASSSVAANAGVGILIAVRPTGGGGGGTPVTPLPSNRRGRRRLY